MTAKDRKIILIQKDWTVTALAKEIGCRRDELSMTISGARPYPKIRKNLAKKLGVPVSELFPENSIQSGA